MQNSVSTKTIVQKLSGFGKFEVDHKLTCDQFVALSMDHICKTEEEMEQQQAFENWSSALERAFKEEKPPFKDDQENEVYKEILDVFRAFQPAA